MSDADDQTVGSADPRFNEPSSSGEGDNETPKSQAATDENDNDVMTDDDLPSGG